MIIKMAYQQIVCVFTVLIILLSKGCQSQQPACGRSVINSRIVAGQDASPGSWPWHATFEYHGIIFCQGSLINNQWVLTAAQCSLNFNPYFTSYLSGAVVHLGIQSQTVSNPSKVTRTVDYYLCHKDFNTDDFSNDICLVKLSDPVSFTDYIQPVCLASENSTFYDGTTSWVTGFGYNHSWYQPNNFQEVKISIIGNSKCNCLYENSIFYPFYTITENLMCAGSENGLNGTSYGDQGAAIVTKKDSIWVQSGIASVTFSNFYGKPGTYTRVSQYQKWISDRLSGIEPGFVNFSSTASDNDFNYTCPTFPPTTNTTTTFPSTTTTTSPPTIHYTYPMYTYPTTTTTTTTDDSIFSSGVKLTHLMSLSVFVLFLHVFVGTGGT